MDYVVNGSSPDFVYDKRPRTTESTGVLFPNNPAQIPVQFSQVVLNGTSPQPRFLSPYEYHALEDGRGYMVVYARTTYLDISGTKHWTQFCQFFVSPNAKPVQVTAKACTDYNDTDHNESGLFRRLLGFFWGESG